MSCHHLGSLLEKLEADMFTSFLLTEHSANILFCGRSLRSSERVSSWRTYFFFTFLILPLTLKRIMGKVNQGRSPPMTRNKNIPSLNWIQLSKALEVPVRSWKERQWLSNEAEMYRVRVDRLGSERRLPGLWLLLCHYWAMWFGGRYSLWAPVSLYAEWG